MRIHLPARFSPSVLALVMAALALAACVPPAARAPAPATVKTDSELFAQAETALGAGALSSARNYFQALIQNFPASPLVPQAYLQVGRIQALSDDITAAQATFEELIRLYPQKPEAREARIELIAALYRQQRYQEIVDLAPELLAAIEEPWQRYRLYGILGDAHAALHSWADSFYYYALAYPLAPEIGRPRLGEKMAEAANFLTEDEIQLLLSQIKDPTATGYLYLQLALGRAGEGDYDTAVWQLEQFLKRFPDHTQADLARDLVRQMADKVVYERHAVGCLLPLSGAYALFGGRALDGIQLAFDEIRRRYPDLPLRLIIEDTGSDATQAAAAMHSLAAAKPAAIIGPIATAETAAPIAQQARIPIVVLSQREGITEGGENIFRYFVTPRMQAAALANYAVDVMHMRRLGILFPNEKYGETFRDLFWEEVYKKGATVVALEAYDPAGTDFEAPIKKLVGLYDKVPSTLQALREPLDLLGPLSAIPGYRPPPKEEKSARQRAEERSRRRAGDEGDLRPVVDFQGLFIPDAPQMLGLVIPQLAYYDVVNTTLLGTNLWYSPKLIETAGAYAQGAIMPAPFFAQSQSPRVQDFVLRFEAVYGRRPEYIEAVAYDAARILLEIVAQPDVAQRAAVRHELLARDDLGGICGIQRFESDREPIQRLPLLQLHEREFVELPANSPPTWQPSQAAVPPPPPLPSGP
jgi:branched-chain amino acid transport system substrate-binding protein